MFFLNSKRGLLFILFSSLTFPKLIAQDPLRISNLPTIYITTYDGENPVSKEEYKYAEWKYVRDNDVQRLDSLRIRCRGNSTFYLPKKSYRIKFKDKQNLVGSAKSKNWTLLANCSDKTLIRNALAFELGKFCGMQYNPSYEFVDLVLNGIYLGTYQLTDHIEVGKGRVDITKQTDRTLTGGYLCEISDYETLIYHEPTKPCFRTERTGAGIMIKYPDEDDITEEQISYIKDFLNEIESRLYSDNFTDDITGYRSVIDTFSLIKYYLCQEICGNPDGMYSTFITKECNDERICFGPLWDFDIAWNNCYRIGDITEFLMKERGYGETAVKQWFDKIWEDNWFQEKVYDSYTTYVSSGLEQFLINKCDSLLDIIRVSAEENYKQWSLSQRYYDELYIHSSFEDYSQDLRQFIKKRISFLSDEFQKISTKVLVNEYKSSKTHSYYNYDLKGVKHTNSNHHLRIEVMPNGKTRKVVKRINK